MANTTDSQIIEGLADTKSFRTQTSVLTTSASTLTLTLNSEHLIIFTGTTAGQIVRLQDATTVTIGYQQRVHNNSTQDITIQDGAGTVVGVLRAGLRTLALLQVAGTIAGAWSLEFMPSLNITQNYIPASNLTDFIAAMTTLNGLKGGTIHITNTVTLTSNVTWDFSNIRIVADSSIRNAFVLNGFVITLGGTGAFFQNCRFTGAVTTAGTRSQLMMNFDPTSVPNFVWFDNCMFKNIMGSVDFDVTQTPSGVVIDGTAATGDFANIIFENCNSSSDWYGSYGSTPYLAPLTIRFAHGGGYKQIFITGQIGQTEGRNKYAMAPLAGTASASTRVTFNTDGSGVYYGTLEVPSLGVVSYSRSVASYSLKRYLAATTGTTLSTIKEDPTFIDEGLILVNAATANQTLTMPPTPFFMDGHTYTFDKRGPYNFILNPNVDTIENSASAVTIRGYNVQASLTMDQINNNWLLTTTPKQNITSVATTNAVQTTIATFVVPTNSVLLVEARILALRTGGSAGTTGDCAVYIRRARFKNVAGTVTMLGLSTEYTNKDVPAYDATLGVSGTSGQALVTGVLNTNITWTCSLSIEVLV